MDANTILVLHRERKMHDEEAFKKALCSHLPDVITDQVANYIYRRAWERGHSDGFGEVEDIFDEILDCVVLALGEK